MKQQVYASLAFFAFVCCFSLSAQNVHVDYVDGELFWRVRAGSTIQLPDSILQEYQVTLVQYPFAQLNPNKLKGRLPLDQLHRTRRIRFQAAARVTELRNYLAHLPQTELVERVPLYRIDFTPNDPQFASQWHLAQIDATNAWNLSFGNNNVSIAVVDDAVLTTHQDLAPSIWVNPLEIAGNGIDDDGNGYIDDVSGYDVADLDNNPNPPLAFATNSVYTHGTHCAGIAGAATNNSQGIASIGFGVKLIPVKCNNDATPGPSLPAAYDGLAYAISVLPDVISLSWGGPGGAATGQALMDLAYANDIVVVAAAGNSNVTTPMYPASYNHVISVAATDPGDLKASFSNYGATIDVSAPGVNIPSTLAGSTSSYGNLSGTSMATPLVAGLAGLMRSFNPSKTVDDIEACLKSTADPIDLINPTYAGQLGAGRINAFHALQCVTGPPIAVISPNFNNVCPGASVQFTDQSYGSPTAWAWTFPGGTPASSTAQHPLVQYNTPGVYSVSLTVTNPNGSNSTTYNSITVAIPTATMSGGGLVNLGSPATINVSFTGSPPFNFTYFNGVTNTTVNGITGNTYSFVVTPSTTTTYTPVSVSNSQCTGTIFGSAVVTVSNGCSASINFQQILGGLLEDNPYSVKQTPDCGYVVCGNTISFGTGMHDALLAKLDPNGNLTWFRTFGDASDASTFTDVIAVANGYVCVGSRGVNNQGRMYIVKTDLNGNLMWQQHMEYISGGGAVYSHPGEVVEMANGDIALAYYACHTNFNSTGQGMARLNGTNGAVIWHRNAQVNNFENARAIVRTPAGNLVSAGDSRSAGSVAGLYDMSLTERDANGNLVWSRNYGGVANEYGNDLVQLPDGGYLMVGLTQSFGASVSDIMLIRTTSTGALTWARTYARPAEDRGLKIVPGCNGKYFVAAASRTAGAGNDALLFQIDLNGNVLWARAVGGVLDDGNIVSLGRAGDCGCILGLNTLSYGVGEFDMMVVKTDSLGAMSCHSTPATLTVTTVSPSTFAAALGAGNAPTNPVWATTVQAHTPVVPADVCDACGTPVADFDFVTNVLSLACIDNSVNGQHWFWNFGDGSPLDTFPNAVHEYAGPGIYTVTLIVTSACGADTISKQVTISGLNECLHVMQPGPVKGFDSDVFSRDDATNSNLGSSVYYGLWTWTWSGIPGTGRSYIRYDLSRICNTATLLDARMSVFYDPAVGQPHTGANSGATLSRVTSNWDEYAVTWLNQPTTTAVNQIAVPTVTGTNNLTNFAVTPLFQALINGPNFGFQWRHVSEVTYVRTIWNSSDYPVPATRPRLSLRFDPIYAYATAQPSGSHSVTICRGDSVQLNLAGYLNGSTTSGPSTATSYLWVPSVGLSCATCPNPKASPDSTITYRAVAYNCPSCADIDSIRVTVSQVWVDAPDKILCAGDSVQMQAFHPTPGASFVWTPTTTLTPPNVQNPYAYPTVPTWYYVTATDATHNCVSRDSALVLTGYPSPLPTLINDTILSCSTGTLTFPLNPDFTPIGSDYYEWNLVGNITPDPHSPSSDAVINTNIAPASYHYVLTVTNEFGCVSKDSVDVDVVCVPLDGAGLTFGGEALPGSNLLHWQTAAGNTSRHFTLQRSADGQQFEAIADLPARGDGSRAQAYQHQDVLPQGDRYYRLLSRDVNGETHLSATVLLSASAEGLAIYPNPSTGRFFLNSASDLADSQIRVYNALGQVIFQAEGQPGHQMALDLGRQAPGVYVLAIQTTQGQRKVKITIE